MQHFVDIKTPKQNWKNKILLTLQNYVEILSLSKQAGWIQILQIPFGFFPLSYRVW